MNVALVTGGTRGIGLAISRKLASEGYDLVLGYHSNDKAALSAKNELSGYGVRVETVAGDIGQAETVDNLFRVIEKHFASKLTVLIHQAGHAIGGKLPGEFTFEQYEEAQRLYPKAFLRCMEGALKYLPNDRGRSVVLSSHGVHDPGIIYAMAAPAKAAMETLAKNYALMLAPRGITVNIVSPGYTKTEAWKGYLKAFPYVDKMPPQATPMGRWGQPEDIAPVVSFLCSEESRFVTGQNIYVDGGLGLSLFYHIHRMGERLAEESEHKV